MNETQTAAVHPLEEMGISREVVQAFDWMGFQNLTAIQQKCIPLMMDGHDIIAIAPTGTGKTLGFGIPMLEYVNLDDSNIQEVVLAPTRELAQQIADELTHLAHFIKGLKIAVIYGGQPFGKQMSALSRKPQVLVATPGRLLDHMQRGNIRLGTVRRSPFRGNINTIRLKLSCRPRRKTSRTSRNTSSNPIRNKSMSTCCICSIRINISA